MHTIGYLRIDIKSKSRPMCANLLIFLKKLYFFVFSFVFGKSIRFQLQGNSLVRMYHSVGYSATVFTDGF